MILCPGQKIRDFSEIYLLNFSIPIYPWRVRTRAAAQVVTSKHFDPLRQRADAVVEYQSEIN